METEKQHGILSDIVGFSWVWISLKQSEFVPKREVHCGRSL